MSILIVAVFLIPAAVSVAFAWWSWRAMGHSVSASAWKNRLTFYSLIAASLGFFLETVFMVRSCAFSYLPSPSLPWVLASWIAVFTWLIAIVAATLGRGTVRWFLVSYALTSVAGIYVFLNLIMN